MMKRIGALALVLLVAAGCAAQAQQGAVIGGVSGGLIGAAAGRSPGAAALGVLIGGLLGAIVGDAAAHAPPPGPPPPPPGSLVPPPPPPGGQWAVVNPVPPPPPPAPGPPPDPTRGMMTNSTPWEVHVFIDQPPGSPGPLVLRSGDSAPVNLDIGRHRIVAQAFVDTQYGRRLVGTFDQTLAVDPRAPGWTIRFFEANF